MIEPDVVTTPEATPSVALSSMGSEGLHEFIRYVVASAIALVLDIATLSLLTSILGVPYLVSGAVAFLVGLTAVYILSVRWVFAVRALSNPWTEFLLFAGIGVVGLLINEAVLYLFTSVFGFFYLVSKIASVIFVFTWNFGARKIFLFKTRIQAA
ncbi:MAG: GtrA family protein [Candidatus Pacebacteria bacterium]|nr:GtrA family protein [Candidatus Paceibacterota bacterium]